MVLVTINLSEKSTSFIELYKVSRGMRSKNEAINKLIEEFKELKKEEFTEKMLSFDCSLTSQKALAKEWLSKEDEEAFAYLQ